MCPHWSHQYLGGLGSPNWQHVQENCCGSALPLSWDQLRYQDPNTAPTGVAGSPARAGGEDIFCDCFIQDFEGGGW